MNGFVVAAVVTVLVAVWASVVGSVTLDDDALPLTARLMGGVSLLIVGFVLGLTAVALFSASFA